MPDDVRSLYRRYRSRTFAELIGQEHISRTLLNALQAGRIAHAYLFAGPRGSGKTSAARILAKAVNCLTNGGRGEPCNECEICTAINEGRALDLIEIDAASNRGIDEIRDLRDKVHFAPTQARYKVYILDEAHMLTNEAFNALLKTLEEPPAHVIFALVTTEAHKIPPTIVSRCQRFDFRRASTKDILAKLNRICQEEQIKAEPAALSVIARAATGSYRDAESLLDQLASFTGDEGITLNYVRQVLGLAPLEAISRLVAHIARRETAAGLRLLSEIVQGGADLRQFTRELVDYLRNLVMIKTGNEMLLDVMPETLEEMRPLARAFSMTDLVRLIKLFSHPDVASGLRASAQPQLLLELAFLEACGNGATTVAGDAIGQTVAPVDHSLPTSAPASRPSVGTSAAVHSTTPTSTPSSASPARLTTPASTRTAPSPIPAARASAPSALARPTTTYSRQPTQPVVTAPPGTPLAEVQEKWLALLEAVKADSRSVEAFLKECHPIEADKDIIVLGFHYPFHKESVDNPKNRALVEQAFARVLAHSVHIRCTLTPKSTSSSTPSRSGSSTTEPSDPVVKAAQELFNAAVVTVEKAEDE